MPTLTAKKAQVKPKVKESKAEELGAQERILLAAREEFAGKGFAGARMQKIAERASINKGMLHYYFNSKEELHVSVLKSLFELKKDIVCPTSMEGLALSDPREKLYVVIYTFVHIQFNHFHEYKMQIIAWEIAEGRKHLRHLVQNFFVPHIENIENIIKEGVEQGYFETQNPLFTVLNIIWFVVAYRMHEVTYRGSSIYERLYGKDQKRVCLSL